MTTPQLSITVAKQYGKFDDPVGRLYRMPKTEGFGPVIYYREAMEGLCSYKLFPSITNVISTMGHDFQGWAKHEMAKHILGNFDGENLDQVVRDGRLANELYTQHACDRGTEVHKAIEDQILTGEHDEFVHGGELYYKGWEKFHEDFQPEYLKLEVTVFGKTKDNLYYAGTIDGIARINGKVYALDWKTSKTIHSEVGIQLAAGKNAALMTNDEMTDTEPMMAVDGLLGIHLKADGTYGVHKINDEEYCWETFQSLRQGWEWKAFEGGLWNDPLTHITDPNQL